MPMEVPASQFANEELQFKKQVLKKQKQEL
jgi:hypothetical protein